MAQAGGQADAREHRVRQLDLLLAVTASFVRATLKPSETIAFRAVAGDFNFDNTTFGVVAGLFYYRRLVIFLIN